MGRTGFLVGDLGKHGQFRDLHKEIGSMVSRCDLAYPGLGSDHRGARPWPAPDRRTLAEAYSCPCRAAHFELRSFHDSGAWPPRTLELLRLLFLHSLLYTLGYPKTSSCRAKSLTLPRWFAWESGLFLLAPQTSADVQHSGHERIWARVRPERYGFKRWNIGLERPEDHPPCRQFLR